MLMLMTLAVKTTLWRNYRLHEALGFSDRDPISYRQTVFFLNGHYPPSKERHSGKYPHVLQANYTSAISSDH